MDTMLLILVAVSLQAIADATQLTFTKIDGNMFVETSPEKFAMFNQIKDEARTRITTFDTQGQYSLSSDCDTEWNKINKIDEKTLSSYREIREKYLAEKRSPAESPQSFTWSVTYSSDQKEYSVMKLDANTIVYSSKFFPNKLAKVIISEGVIIFAHYDGTLTMKTINCLFSNEKILMEAIKKIDLNGKKSSIFSSKGEKALRNHLESKPFSERYFNLEQRYAKSFEDKLTLGGQMN